MRCRNARPEVRPDPKSPSGGRRFLVVCQVTLNFRDLCLDRLDFLLELVADRVKLLAVQMEFMVLRNECFGHLDVRLLMTSDDASRENHAHGH